MIRRPELLTCLLGNVYASKVRIEHVTISWFKLGKEYVKAIFLPCLFNFCSESIMKNKILDQSQARNKIYVGDMNNLSYPDDRRTIGTRDS